MREQRPIASVYAIGTVDGGSVKIGYSTLVEDRLRVLRATSPVALVLHWCTAGPRALEQHLHQVFHERRQHSEWFDFRDGDVVGLIQAAAEKFGTQPSRPSRPVSVRSAAEPMSASPSASGAKTLPCEVTSTAILLAIIGAT
jgi:hypothetical protein